MPLASVSHERISPSDSLLPTSSRGLEVALARDRVAHRALLGGEHLGAIGLGVAWVGGRDAGGAQNRDTDHSFHHQFSFSDDSDTIASVVSINAAIDAAF
jgi:hypothetical protein